ncbi:MFS transporter [Candidatus Parcubacteria bacterium]|nr:MFS transporter [Candidatus Parcubacteria bacterium]
MEKTTFDVSLVHFLLMFGYKLFSLYYPLFLISIGFSIMNVGSIYLLTYSVIAISSVIINYYIHKFNPSKVAAFGIFGYGIFALLMIVSHNLTVFYIAQIILGFSAAAWLVSLKLILMKSETDSHSRSFGWFYSMPHYAAAFAPVIGGIVIWKFGFTGVFVLSVIIQFANTIYAYARLNGNLTSSRRRHVDVSPTEVSSTISIRKNYTKIFNIIKPDKTFIVILTSLFAALILVGIYRAFFVLFLKELHFSQEEIIRFISLAAIAYLPLSIIVIKIVEKFRDAKTISGGMTLEGLITIMLGTFASVVNLIGMFFVMVISSLSALTMESGKSALLSKKLKNYQEEASTIDTVITTLGPAIGALFGGIMIFYIGFQNTFLIAGVIVFLLGLISWFYKLNHKL